MNETNNETSPWIHQDLSLWEDILRDKIPHSYSKRTFLFRQGDMAEYVFIIRTGRVRITSYHPAGGEKQMYIAETGAMVGELACIQNLPYTVSAVAIVDSQVYRLTYKTFENKMRSDWNLAKRIMQSTCRKSHIFMEQILELSFNDSLQRVARILLNIAAQYGQIRADGCTQLGVKFTHQDVASMINSSRVTTSNVFNALSSAGIIAKERGYYVLKDIQGLKKYLSEID